MWHRASDEFFPLLVIPIQQSDRSVSKPIAFPPLIKISARNSGRTNDSSYEDSERTGREQVSSAEDYKIKNAWELVTRFSETCWKPELRVVPLVEIGIPRSKILDVIEQYKIEKLHVQS